MVAGLGGVEAHREGDADGGGAEVADLPHERRPLQLLGGDARLPEAAEGLGVGLAGADGGVVAGAALGLPLEAGEGVLGGGAVRVEQHLKPVAGLRLGAEAPHVVHLPAGAGLGAEAGDAAGGAHHERGGGAGGEGVAHPVLVGDEVVGGHHQRRRAVRREGGGDRERVEEGPGVAAHVEGGRAVQAEGAGQRRRQLPQPERRGLADGDHHAGGVAAVEGRHRRLVRHRQGVLVEGGGGEGLGPGAPGPAVELLDLPQGGPVLGQVRPVPEDLPHRASA